MPGVSSRIIGHASIEFECDDRCKCTTSIILPTRTLPISEAMKPSVIVMRIFLPTGDPPKSSEIWRHRRPKSLAKVIPDLLRKMADCVGPIVSDLSKSTNLKCSPAHGLYLDG